MVGNLILMSEIMNDNIKYNNSYCCDCFKTFSSRITQNLLTHLLSATTLSIFGLPAQRAAAEEGVHIFATHLLRPL